MNVRESEKKKRDTHDVSKGIVRVYEFQSIDYSKFYRLVSKVFGFPDYQRVRRNTLQENWQRRGLFINVNYLDNISGIVNLLVTITQEETWNEFVTSLYRINPKITGKSVHNLSTELLREIMGKMTDELSMRLQIVMDRRAKIIQTLSNIIKKMSQTTDSIIRNLK